MRSKTKGLDVECGMRLVNKLADGRICISDYISKYYSNKNKGNIIIPPLGESEKPYLSQNSKVQFVYAGIPFRIGKNIRNRKILKDRLDIIIKYFSKIDSNIYPYTFDIYGVTKEDYLTCFPEDKKYIEKDNSSIFFHGKMSNTELKDIIRKANYTILYREEIRTNKAGFSTKISESINLGTPVITTCVGDISQYLTNGEDAYFLKIGKHSYNVELLKSIIKKTLNNQNENKKYVENNKYFHYERYLEKIEPYIFSLEQKGEKM